MEETNPVTKQANPINVARGKKSRASGADFERRTRKDLEDNGWIVDKWSNNLESPKITTYNDGNNVMGVDFAANAFFMAPAKRKYAGPGRPMAIGTGFPDFIAFKNYAHDKFIWTIDSGQENDMAKFSEKLDAIRKNNVKDIIVSEGVSVKQLTKTEIIGVECKTNGTLDRTEKEKCRWYLDNKIFSKILIASKTKVKNRIVIKYEDFEERYGNS